MYFAWGHNVSQPDARLARFAGPSEPRHGNTLALLDTSDPRAKARDCTDALVTGNEWNGGLDGPVSVGRVKVSVTKSLRLDLDDDLTVAGLGNRHLFEAERGTE